VPDRAIRRVNTSALSSSSGMGSLVSGSLALIE
jgi:hypothetical protein